MARVLLFPFNHFYSLTIYPPFSNGCVSVFTSNCCTEQDVIATHTNISNITFFYVHNVIFIMKRRYCNVKIYSLTLVNTESFSVELSHQKQAPSVGFNSKAFV